MLVIASLTRFKVPDGGTRAVITTALKRAGFLVEERGERVRVGIGEDPHLFAETIKPFTGLIEECRNRGGAPSSPVVLCESCGEVIHRKEVAA